MFSVAGAQAPWPKESQAHAPTAGGFLEDRDHILKRSHLSEMRHKHPLKTSEEHISSPRHSMGLPYMPISWGGGLGGLAGAAVLWQSHGVTRVISSNCTDNYDPREVQ